MKKAPHLIVSISGHGFGHVAQTAPILNQLHRQMPQLHLTVRSSVAKAHLQSRIHAPFTLLDSQGDIGMMMNSPLLVDVEQSRTVYQRFHADWDQRVSEEAQILRELEADMVFSNVGYLPLAGAQQAGISNIALCSLNWSDIYRHYCGGDLIAGQIQQSYANADAFLRATPGMAMNDLNNLIAVSPIAAIGQNHREKLNRHLGLSGEYKLVLISMGGISSRVSVENWPRIKGVRWLVQESWQTSHPDAIVFDTLPFSFSDLLASCDALICKPGYGSFVEATCSNVPLLYVDRPDWPESPALIEWLKKHAISREISSTNLEQGHIVDDLQELWNTPKSVAFSANGAKQVACWIQEHIE